MGAKDNRRFSLNQTMRSSRRSAGVIWSRAFDACDVIGRGRGVILAEMGTLSPIAGRDFVTRSLFDHGVLPRQMF